MLNRRRQPPISKHKLQLFWKPNWMMVVFIRNTYKSPVTPPIRNNTILSRRRAFQVIGYQNINQAIIMEEMGMISKLK